MTRSPVRSRSRSRSPAPRPKVGGFRWKGDRQGNATRHRDRRDRSPRRDRSRSRDRDNERPRARDSVPNRIRGRDANQNREKDRGEERKQNRKPENKTRNPAPPAPTGGGEEMIIVNINDRLGTKAAIPCLGSDTIAQLKLLVAMRIGREPNQIILKRQSERPFKDQLTLDDYGISNGVQLDLEVDTRD